jgi:hypothetical protein
MRRTDRLEYWMPIGGTNSVCAEATFIDKSYAKNYCNQAIPRLVQERGLELGAV